MFRPSTNDIDTLGISEAPSDSTVLNENGGGYRAARSLCSSLLTRRGEGHSLWSVSFPHAPTMFLLLSSKSIMMHVSDVQEKNILFALDEPEALQAFEDKERTDPVPRKVVGDRVIYQIYRESSSLSCWADRRSATLAKRDSGARRTRVSSNRTHIVRRRSFSVCRGTRR